MGRMKVGIAVAGAVFVLLGVVATATMRSDSSPDRAETVANQAPAETLPAAGPGVASSVPATQPAKAAPTTPSTKPSAAAAAKVADAKSAPLATIPTQPTAQDIERVMAAITASMVPAAGTTATTAPLTKEQVEAQLREQLKLLGITY